MSITIFSPSQLNAMVATIPPLPNGHRSAIVGTVDQAGAKVIAAFSLGTDKQFQLSGAVEHDWNGDNKAGAQFLTSW